MVPKGEKIMSIPSLTTNQKAALKSLMDDYYNAESCFEYLGRARRESYATPAAIPRDSSSLNGCMSSEAHKYFLNCGLFAQMIWMGRKIEDFTSHPSTPVRTISKDFSWGYYFHFLSARNAYGALKPDGSYYSQNTYTRSDGGKEFITFDNAASMAQELSVEGYEIPYGEADVGDLVFYRTESLIDGDKDELEEASFRNISHVGVVYKLTADGIPIIMECTTVYSKALGKCGIDKVSGSSVPSRFGLIRGANLEYRVVMCARHPVAYGHSGNVPSMFYKYRGTGVDPV